MAVTTAGSARVDVSPKASASVSPAAILRRMRLPAPPASHVTPAGQRVTCPRTASELGAAQGGGHARVSTGSDAAAATANASMPTGAGTTRCWQGKTNQARRRDANHEVACWRYGTREDAAMRITRGPTGQRDDAQGGGHSGGSRAADQGWPRGRIITAFEVDAPSFRYSIGLASRPRRGAAMPPLIRLA